MWESPLLWCRFLDTSVISLGPREGPDRGGDHFLAFVQESIVLFSSPLTHSYCEAVCSPMDLDWRLFFFSCASNCGKSVLRQLLRVCSLAALPWLKGWVSNFPEHKWFNGTGRISWKYWIRNFMPSGPMHLSVSTWSQLSLSSGPGETFWNWSQS